MNRSSHSLRTFAALGSTLAGYVDAIGFIETKGYFVSFMSGNSTRLGVGLLETSEAIMPALLIGCFVVGVTGGSLIGRACGRRHIAAVFAAVGVTLAVASLLGGAGLGVASMFVVALAMGAENAAIEANGEVRIGLTYMTGALVKLGQHLASAIRGGPRWSFLPNLVLWAGMVAGAVVGAACHPLLGSDALWPAAGASLALAVAAVIWADRLSD